MRSPIWHPFTQHGLGEEFPTIVSASGAALHTADGRRIVDGISSWWVTTHGHCHPRIMAAIQAQAERLDQIIFAGFTHEPAEQLAAALRTIMPDELGHIFFSDSGSTSVEVALKMALGYWRNRGEPRHRSIVMAHSYHGDTIGAMSVGARGTFNQSYAPLLFDVDSIPFPGSGQEQLTLDRLEAHCRAGAAALIVEPLALGAGGMLFYPAWVLQQMREICSRHGVLMIADEVMTAWGRTGTLLACEQANVVPDLLCLSKGLTGGALPLAVTMATSEIFEAHWSDDRSRMFFHSSSYTANPIACAAALANVQMWLDEPVIDRTEQLSRAQANYLAKLESHGAIANARQLGTIAAFEVVGRGSGYLSDIAPRLLKFGMDRGVLVRPLGNTVYIMPPYCIDADDLGQIYSVIREFLGQSLTSPD